MFYVLLLLGILSQIGHTKDHSNSFLVWVQQYAQDARHDHPSWVCGPLPASNHSPLPWWLSPLHGNDWRKLQGYINEAQAKSMVLRRATRSDVSQWPINMTLNQEGHGKNFSKDETDAITKRFYESLLPNDTNLLVIREKNHHFKDGYYQIWDERLWLTSSLARLSLEAPLCWEQQNHSHPSRPRTSKFVGWIHAEWCQHTIILQAEDWFATDWSSRPAVRWAAPNGTQWLCGTNLWPWLPPGWIGRCTLGFPWMQARWTKAPHQPANDSVSAHSRNHSVLHHHKRLSSHSARSLKLWEVVWHIDSLAQFLDKALNHTSKEMSLLDFEDHLMRKAVLQHRMARDTLKAAKGGKCTILRNECCVHLHKPVRPGTTRFDEELAHFSKTSVWKWVIITVGVILTLILIAPLLVKLVLTFMSSRLQSDHESMVLFHCNEVMFVGPPAPPPTPESEHEEGP